MLGCYFSVLVISQEMALDDNVVPHEIRSLTFIRKKENEELSVLDEIGSRDYACSN